MRKLVGVLLLVLVMSLGFVKEVQEYVKMPKTVTVFQSQTVSVDNTLPVNANQHYEEAFTVQKNNDGKTLDIHGKQAGEGEVVFDLAGFPVKKAGVKVLPDFKVIPGGQSIGVKLNTLGVLVVGHHQIDTTDGKKSPGELAGVEIGDIITHINGKKLNR